MSALVSWEAFVAERFPAYLLPQACRGALSEEAAALFLERIGGGPRSLYLLRAASVLAGCAGQARELAHDALPLLVRGLSPRTEVELAVAQSPQRGRLDVAATLKQRLEGRPSHAAFRLQRRRFNRPEDALVKAVARRLLQILGDLRAAGLLAGAGWSEGLPACEDALRQALATTALRDVPDEPITSVHERAAIEEPRYGYSLAARLYRALADALDAADPEAVARAVAEGALLPLTASIRFELAVLLRLLEALWERLNEREPGAWAFHRTAIVPDRGEIAEFERQDGGRMRIFYNQALLDPGPHAIGVRRYLGREGRLRPDITIVMEPAGEDPRAVVVEAKLSSDPEYLAQGYRQALLYCHEYASQLAEWPKAILVTSSPLPGASRREDEVIAIDWDRWVPPSVLDAMIGFLMRSPF